MRTLKLSVAYDGTDYSGWQVQPEQPTIQEALETAITKVTGVASRVVGSGRTDAGVHALGQVASLDTESQLAADVLLRAINAELPRTIAVLTVVEAIDGFHAIRDAVTKRYRYVISDTRIRDVFALRYCWHCTTRLDVERMQNAAHALVGRHDFASFQSSGAERESTVRTISDLGVRRDNTESGPRIVIEIEADGFLYNMVRAIVGTLVEVGRGARDVAWPASVLAARDRRAGGPTAPAQGLFLVQVGYPDAIETEPPCA